ncbi:MAG: dethiobiotin synthase, partial [Halobacteria archaeon]|nr:dethiobiotin synthase [Halobacteria archaeon]
MSADGVFVAGTDTGVGKTVVTAGIARTLELKDQDVGAVKPSQTGCFREGNVYCPFRYEPPLAPTVADEVSEELDGKSLSYDSVLENVRREVGGHDVAVVEGIGGVRVPLADDGEVIDLAVELGSP